MYGKLELTCGPSPWANALPPGPRPRDAFHFARDSSSASSLASSSVTSLLVHFYTKAMATNVINYKYEPGDFASPSLKPTRLISVVFVGVRVAAYLGGKWA